MLPCLVINFPSYHVPSRVAQWRLNVARRKSVTEPPTDILNTQSIDRAPTLKFLSELGLDTSAAAKVLEQVEGSVDVQHVEQVCHTLVDTVGIPISKLGQVLASAPQLISLSPATLTKNFETIAGAWPKEKMLRDAITAYPMVLSSTFPEELKRCIATLKGMGFSNSQVAAMVTKEPVLVSLRRYEITSSIAKCGILTNFQDPVLFEMYSKNPSLLTPSGSKVLMARLDAVKKELGVSPQQAQHVVSNASTCLFKLKSSHIHDLVESLRDSGLSRAEIQTAVLSWPSLLCRELERVREVMDILSYYKISPSAVIDFPLVFSLHPNRKLSPRLAFLNSTDPSALKKLSLSTILACSDDKFIYVRGNEEYDTLEDYEEFKLKLLVKQRMTAEAQAKRESEKGAQAAERKKEQPQVQQVQQQRRPPPLSNNQKKPGPVPSKFGSNRSNSNQPKRPQQQQQKPLGRGGNRNAQQGKQLQRLTPQQLAEKKSKEQSQQKQQMQDVDAVSANTVT